MSDGKEEAGPSTPPPGEGGGPWSTAPNGEGPRSPWEQPTSGRAGSKRHGPSALDQLIQTGRSRFGGGGGGGGPDFAGRPLWLWGIAAAVLLWLVLTSLHTIGPQQRGVITRLGQYAGTMRPGLGVTLPAPIDIVTKIDVDEINSFDVGSGDDSGPEDNLVLTGDQNLVDLAYSVRWNIRDPELYLFELADPQTTIREVAESAMREEMARVSLNDAIGPQRSEIAARVAARMQELLDDYRSGVLVQGVAIKQADPPGPVIEAFKSVTAARQTSQSYLNRARAYAQQLGAKASGEATAFDRIYAQYKLAPQVTRQRLYYETMERVLSKTDKTIVDAPGLTPYLPVQPPVARAGAAR